MKAVVVSAMLFLALPLARAEEPPPKPGAYTGKVLLPVEGGGFGVGGNLTDEPCSVTIGREGEQAVVEVSFLPGARVALTARPDRSYHWGRVDQDQAVVVRSYHEDGRPSAVTHTVIELDGWPGSSMLGSGKFFRECLIGL